MEHRLGMNGFHLRWTGLLQPAGAGRELLAMVPRAEGKKETRIRDGGAQIDWEEKTSEKDRAT